MPIPQAQQSPLVDAMRKVTLGWLQFFNTLLSVMGFGFGNGAAGTAVTTAAHGTGSGPAAPQTIVNYVKVNINGTIYWMALFQ